MDLKPIEKLRPFQKFCLTIGELPVSYLESMTYLELLYWFINFLQEKVIPTVNNNAEAVEELQTLFTQLHNYVENYFDNLDVQDEINHKLDEMVEDGTLESILLNYVNIEKIYNTTIEMIADYDNLLNNMKIKTLGYYDLNDGGGADFIITNTSNNNYQINLQNGLYAEMIIINDTINFKQLGAKPFNPESESQFDNKPIMDLYVSICEQKDHKYTLLIDDGIWCFSPTLISRFKGVDIRGKKIFPREANTAVTIVPLNDNQEYIWKVGGLADVEDVATNININQMTTCSHFEGLQFRTNYDNLRYTVLKGCFYIDSCMYMTFEDIYVFNFRGNGLVIRSSWELNFKTLMFRGQRGFEYTSLLFANNRPITNVAANISSLDIDSLMFEGNDGKYIYSQPYSGFSHNHIGHINIETVFGGDATSQTDLHFNTDVSDCIPIDMISGFYRFFLIDSINIVYNSPKIANWNNNKYYLRSLICDDNSENPNEYTRRSFISISNILYRTVVNRSKLAVYRSKASYEFSGFSLGLLSFQDGSPQKIFDCDYSNPPAVGQILLVNKPYIKYNDAFIYASRQNVCYDETSPTLGHLIVKKATGTDQKQIINLYSEKKGTSETPLKFHVLVKNNSESDKDIILYTFINGSRSFSRITVPVSDEWQEFTVSRACDLNSNIMLWTDSTSADVSVAKFWYE